MLERAGAVEAKPSREGHRAHPAIERADARRAGLDTGAAARYTASTR